MYSKFLRAAALLLTVLTLLPCFAGCKKKPASPSSSEAGSSDTASSDTASSGAASSGAASSEKEPEPIRYEDYNETVSCLGTYPMTYVGETELSITYVSNCAEALYTSTAFTVEQKKGTHWYPVAPTDPIESTDLAVELPAYGSIHLSYSLEGYSLDKTGEYRLVRHFVGETVNAYAGGKISVEKNQIAPEDPTPYTASPMEESIRLIKGGLFLQIETEQAQRFWQHHEEDELATEASPSYTLYYADLATTGDHAGVYSMYDMLRCYPVCSEGEDGKMQLTIPLVKEGLPSWPDDPTAGHTYDFCLAVSLYWVETEYYTFRVTMTEQNVQDFEAIHEIQNDWILDDPLVCMKPALYLYPETETEVSVKLTLDGSLTAQWPPYGDGWQVTARPDGMLVDADGYEYPYLYWESEQNFTPDFSRGFCVPGENTGTFLRDTLSAMGLTPKEYTDFIVYWMPLMQQNAYNVIAFQQEAYTDSAVLEITPAPDSLLRVHMCFYGSDTPVEMQPQEIVSFQRTGFTALEWGGSIAG